MNALPLLAALLAACSSAAEEPSPPAPRAAKAPRPSPAAQAAAIQDAVHPASAESAGPPALTIYNGDFAVVRELLALDLASGVNRVAVSGMTRSLEADSVILRDPTGARALSVLEQNYRNDPVSQELLLSLFEGQTIDFQVVREGGEFIVPGRIVRSGYVPASQLGGYDRWGNWRPPQPGVNTQPIIEVEGKLRFSLPGLPLFPSLSDDTVLEPTLHWLLATDRPGSLKAELAYVTGGVNWEASYNAVAPETGESLDLVGWITMQNQSGKTYRDATIKLMAGDVNKLEPQGGRAGAMKAARYMAAEMDLGAPVTEKAFDEFHLYTLARATTLRDSETKQVEFVRAEGVESQRLYVYDGAAIDPSQWSGWDAAALRNNPDYGTQSNKKVWVMREFENSEENGLGLPLPKGKVRFYTRDADGQLEFTGENLIDHTPKDETVRVYTGNAFDLVGERKRTDFRIQDDQDWLDESFEITLRNHKTEAVEFRVVEHLYRWTNWEIRTPSSKSSRPTARRSSSGSACRPTASRS
ncbi:MAG TPA: hypothetical protein VFD43_07930 [Planctomycetota bacterium]|nr:hypothetical protein [Planctomycetota bacterium]